MSTSVAIDSAMISAVSAQNSIAMAQASLVQDTACLEFVQNYRHDPSNVGATHEYVACAERLYPQSTEFVPMSIETGIAFVLLCAVISAVRNKEGDRIDSAEKGFVFGLIAFIVIGLVAPLVI